MDQMIPSIWAPGWFGILFPRMAALPRWSRMLILLHRWEVASPSSWPVWRARAAPSFFTSLLASGCHPPKVSATIGKKAIPCLLHSSSAPLILRSESEQKFSFMTKPQLSNLQQTVAKGILIINISNSNNLNKFWVSIFIRQGHINQVY